MESIETLYREMDPLRPLAAHEDALYVDWQRALDPGTADVKSRLVRSFARNASPQHPITRLLTGHKGSGKTTELNRVTSRLRSGAAGKKVFVSTLYAQRWLDIEDVQPEDLVLQIVRQLVTDLSDAGLSFGVERLTGFLESVWERFRQLRPKAIEVGINPVKFSFALSDFPAGRTEFRDVVREQLPTVYDMVNRELLPKAREYLRGQGFDDLLLVVDDLDKIPQKVLTEQGLTNHENLFLDNASTLRAISCSLLMTIPIELAYSPAQGRLRDDYGSAIGTVPLVSIKTRDGDPVADGERALAEILGKRARVAFGEPGGDPLAAAKRIFATPEDLHRVLRLSGGHGRSLLVMLTELLDWVDELPVPTSAVDRYVPRAAKDLARGLLPADRRLVSTVKLTRDAVDDPRFFDLLRNLYVFAYEAGDEDYWYGPNPLLREVEL